MLQVLSAILRVEPLDDLLEEIAEIISRDFNMKYVLIGLRNEETGLFDQKVLYGYPPEKLRSLIKRTYTLERWKTDMREEFKCGPRCYYVRQLEAGLIHEEDLVYFTHPEEAFVPRKSPEDWQTCDYFDFAMTDKEDNWIGWIEVLEPRDSKVPTRDAIDRMQIFSDLAAIAVENARAFEKAIRAEQESEVYLDLILHDIGNRLTPLIVYHERLASSKTLDPESAKILENLTRISSSIKKLVTNVRTMSKIRKEENPPLSDIQLIPVIDGCMAELRQTYPKVPISIKTEYVGGDIRVLGDDLIYFLFWNLLENALKFNAWPEPRIKIRIIDAGESWRTEIEDNGKGIPDPIKETIFRRFEERTDGVRRSGIGLTLVYQLTKRYKGSIAVRDRVPGDYSQGTCFAVDLPKAR